MTSFLEWPWPSMSKVSGWSEHRVVTNRQGYAELQQWSRSLGEIHAFGIEAQSVATILADLAAISTARPCLMQQTVQRLCMPTTSPSLT